LVYYRGKALKKRKLGREPYLGGSTRVISALYGGSKLGERRSWGVWSVAGDFSKLLSDTLFIKKKDAISRRPA